MSQSKVYNSSGKIARQVKNFYAETGLKMPAELRKAFETITSKKYADLTNEVLEPLFVRY